MAELRASSTDYPAARYALGTELFSNGQLNAAVEELQAFVQAHPVHANAIPAHDQLGRAYMLLGRPDQALEEFRIVLAEPDYQLRGEVQSFVEQINAAVGRGR
jgi:tetratricopeptide (TPR) repeat protein